VLTRWNIEDETGALVMHEFNDLRTVAGFDPVAALCEARRELIRAGMTPRIWAAYSIAIAEQSLPEETKGADSAWIPAR
jgi:CHAT domain-containing protein